MRIILIFAALVAGGCAARVGSTFEQDARRTLAVNPGPNTTAVTFDGGGNETVATTSSGPTRYTTINEGGIRVTAGGMTARDLWLQLPDGTRVLLSSGTDIEAEGVSFNARTGDLTIARFGTSASEPLLALKELQRLAVEYAAARDLESRLAIEAQLRMVEGVAPGVVEALIAGLRSGLGAP